MKHGKWPRWLPQIARGVFGRRLPVQPKSPLHVIISIDVETSVAWGPDGLRPTPIEESILGLRDGKYYGIDLIMQMLEKHGMRGTFFVNSSLDSAYPTSEIKAFVQRIVTRGHDVQFHLHPEFRCLRLCQGELDGACWGRCTRHVSFLAGNSFEAQLALLIEGARNIKDWTGSYPVAFRAGSYRGDETTLKALAALGIHFDSSMHLPSHPLAAVCPMNRLAEHHGVVEVPLYAFRNSLFVKKWDKFGDIESLSLLELKKLVRTAQRNDMRTAVFIMHSFSFCRSSTPYLDHQAIRTVDGFLRFLRADSRVRVITFRELAREYPRDPAKFVGKGGAATLPYWTVVYRSFARFGYSPSNRKIAIANVALVLLLLMLAFWAGGHT